MLTSKLSVCAKSVANSYVLRRNFGACSTLMAPSPAMDTIQKLFLDKLNEYTKLSSGGKLVDMTPEKQKAFDEILNNLKNQYGAAKGEDFTKFPTFNFKEPKLDPINMEEKSQ